MQQLMKLTDSELVQAYSIGNNAAFDTLLNRYQQSLFAYILNVVKDRDLADDIFQETFVKAITTIRQGRYEDTGKFPAWLNRVAHNLIIDHFRRNKAENTVSHDSEEQQHILNSRELSEGTIEDMIVSNQLTDDIRRLIRRLPDVQRQVLVMRIYRNMSFKEIADKTQVSINTALGRMRYALMNMRRMVEDAQLLQTV
jgi:RNA polymerase sigma-70 factor (ECF subfamily)